MLVKHLPRGVLRRESAARLVRFLRANYNRLEAHLGRRTRRDGARLHHRHAPARTQVPLSNVDRTLLDYCLDKRPFAWESFVDRFLMLIVFVVQHTAKSRQIKLLEHDEFDLVSDVFLTLLQNDFAILRRFRGQCSLATYLTVVARRVVVRKLVRSKIRRTSDIDQGT